MGTMTTLCCYWRLCYGPMTLLLDVALWFCPVRRLVLLVGGSIASAVWFVSHHCAGNAHRPFPSWMRSVFVGVG